VYLGEISSLCDIAVESAAGGRGGRKSADLSGGGTSRSVGSQASSVERVLAWTDSFARSLLWELPLELLMDSSKNDTK
jgi:hypothetical protein